MRISYNWLNDYVDISDIAPAKVAEVLTNLGFEIEGIEPRRNEIRDVVVGKVLSCQKHPNADKLSLCEVSDGQQKFQVICGAPNVAGGQTVPFARIGAVLAGGLTLKKAKIRGIESFGMICSAQELGIEPESDGIMVLDDSLEAGKDIVEVLNLKDVIFEVNVTPNRGDALSHYGIARELAAYYKRPLKPRKNKYSLVDSLAEVEVQIEVPELCPRYTAQIIQDVKVEESPYWVKMRLFDLGLSPINNVVDFTNYVLFDSGQPLHAFDLDKLKGNRIIVRRAKEGEKLLLLNGEELELTEEDLVICDEEGPVALAGVMGGELTAVDSGTKNVLLESAFFEPATIRRTTKRHSISSDSSYRFERYIDIEGVPVSSFECAEFFRKYCDAKPSGQILDRYPQKYVPPVVQVSFSRINEVLGTDVSPAEMARIFSALGFVERARDGETVEYQVPSYRRDVAEDMDFAEEIARFVGYDNIPVTMPKAPILSDVVWKSQKYRQIREYMSALGYNEVVNYSFTSPELLDKTERELQRITIVNALSREQSVLRTSLLPQLVHRFVYNLNRGHEQVKLFEIGKIYCLIDDKPYEKEMIAAVAGGKVDNLRWYTSSRDYDFYDLKGEVEALLKRLNLEYTLRSSNNELFFAGTYHEIVVKGEKIGFMGISSIELMQRFDSPEPFGYFELDSEKLYVGKRQYRPIPRFPAVKRDLSLVIKKSQPIGAVLARIKELQPKLVERVSIFDIYESPKIGEENRSITVNVLYRSAKQTLRDEQVNKINDMILKTLQKEFGATLREK